MAGAKVPAPLDPMVNGDDWTNILARLEKTYKGYDGVSLTNWSSASTDRPQIAAGSVIEIGGAPFEYATDETIVDEGGLTDGWCYIKHVVSGDSVTATLTNTFGTWDTAKQGFYDGNDRYSLFAMYRSGAITKIFTDKAEFDAQTAKLGYRYYEKLYTGTTSTGVIYGPGFSDTAFTISQVLTITPLIRLNTSPETWSDSNAQGNQTVFADSGGISYLFNTGSATYGNKPYRVTILYKLSL